MIVFLTGATGKIGQAFVSIFSSFGHRIIMLTRKSPSHGSVQGDLLLPDTYSHALQGVQAVIHMAAVTHSTCPEAYHSVNVKGTAALICACRKAGVSRFIHVSTRVATPDCGAYGVSKAEGERLVRESGLDWTILRPSEVYGAGGNEALENMIAMLRNGPVAPYVSDPRACIAPVHCEDIIAAIAATLERPESIGRSYLLVGPKEYTQKELLLHLRELYKVRTPLVPLPIFLLRAASLFFQLAKLKSPPFVPDQIPRMLCQKIANSDDAARDLGYSPRGIEIGLGVELNQTRKI